MPLPDIKGFDRAQDDYDRALPEAEEDGALEVDNPDDEYEPEREYERHERLWNLLGWD